MCTIDRLLGSELIATGDLMLTEVLQGYCDRHSPISACSHSASFDRLGGHRRGDDPGGNRP